MNGSDDLTSLAHMTMTFIQPSSLKPILMQHFFVIESIIKPSNTPYLHFAQLLRLTSVVFEIKQHITNILGTCLTVHKRIHVIVSVKQYFLYDFPKQSKTTHKKTIKFGYKSFRKIAGYSCKQFSTVFLLRGCTFICIMFSKLKLQF